MLDKKKSKRNSWEFMILLIKKIGLKKSNFFILLYCYNILCQYCKNFVKLFCEMSDFVYNIDI